jgi:hypothetical protein
MMNRILANFIVIGIAAVTALSLYADEPLLNTDNDLPVIPIGFDAYKMWDKWPQQRIGMRAYMRSTYDRDGGNRTADASHYLFGNPGEQNVSLDVKGKGVLYFFRANHWHGSPWHFISDGMDNVVRESATHPVDAQKKFTKTEFIPAEPFPEPLAWTWSTTKGADLIWHPMTFKESFQIAYEHTFYGTGYFIYHLFSNDKNLSQPLKTWDLNQLPDPEVITLLNQSGTDIAPKDIAKIEKTVTLDRETVTLAEINTAGVVRAVKITLPLDDALDLERIRLRATWDGMQHPSIDAPLCLFYGAGTFYNRDNREYLVKGLPLNIRFNFAAKTVELGCYYPMPFFKSAKLELTGIVPGTTELRCEIRHEPLTMPAAHTSYFHATYTDIPEPEPGLDMTFLDTKGTEGHSEWSGNFVGMSFIFSHTGTLDTLEGDPRFFFDDSRSPQAYGTGTEEWGGGGDYWGGRNMTLPLAGHPCGAVNAKNAKHEKDMIESAYRFLLADLMPFGRRAVIGLEHGGENLSTEHYEAVTYWYGLPVATLIKTDTFDVGNTQSERDHHYNSPHASDVETIISRYELGIDTFPAKSWGANPEQIAANEAKAGKDVFPSHEEYGRHTDGTSDFTVSLVSENRGVLLRRTLDYSFPNQTAEVFVSADEGKSWQSVGIWYLAGSNTFYHSFPKDEPGVRTPNVMASNRRFRDDEFLLPEAVTRGHDKIRVQIRTVENKQELLPGVPFPKPSRWSELKYEVYCYVLPVFGRGEQ